MINNAQILQWIEFTGKAIEENKGYLTELDSPIGDADHGINMARGFNKVALQLVNAQNSEISIILKTVGMTLINSVGGASGPLFGSFFLDAAKTTTGKFELTDAELVNLFEAGINAVMRLGKAKPGDKTMLDALIPGLDALKQQTQNQSATPDAMQAMLSAAQSGMEATIPMVARKGRASYLGERSAGHQDPGATSVYLLVKSLHEAVLS